MESKIKFQSFGLGVTSTNTTAELLGGKGAGLVWMDRQGINVPPGFILGTDMCLMYMDDPVSTMAIIKGMLPSYMALLVQHFGYRPLVSVRSGARVSMPGMMDTILNVGIDLQTYDEWAARLGEECAADSDRRLIEMYINVVKDVPRELFHTKNDELGDDTLQAYKELTGEDFPDADGQLLGSIEAVFNSWNNERAKTYRKLNNIPDAWGTACVVQAMVFGNMDDTSCTGVLFTRDPDTGEDVVRGEFLPNAQGEDVVAGLVTPRNLKELGKWNADLACELFDVVSHLEELKKDVQDVEFTVQQGKLYILQTRNAKRSANAAIRIAIDMCEDKMLTPKEALRRVTKRQYALAMQPQLDPKFTQSPVFTGLGASTGVVTGIAVFTSQAAIDCKVPCILVTQETTPDDIGGMHAAVGLLTMTGGSTSHAAVVARGMNKPCVVGLSQSLTCFTEGMTLSICGLTGRVWTVPVPVVGGENNPLVAALDGLMAFTASATLMIDRIPEEADMGSSCIFDASLMNLQPVGVVIDTVKTLLTKYRKITLDFIEGNRHPAYNDFASLVFDSMSFKVSQMMIKLASKLSTEEISRVQVLCTGSAGPFKVIATVNTLEELINASSRFIVSMPITPAVEKVLKWQELVDSNEPVVFGKMAGKGRSFMSREQLISTLLAD